MTLALAQTVAPNGSVVTFENNPKHFKIAKRNVKMSPWSKLVTIKDEELNENTEIIHTASVVLDLPNPWTIVSWAQKSFRIGGFLICYLPTVNQVQKLVEYLDIWQEIEIVETIQENIGTKEEPEYREVKTVDYGKMVGVLINAIKELKAEVKELKGGK